MRPPRRAPARARRAGATARSARRSSWDSPGGRGSPPSAGRCPAGARARARRRSCSRRSGAARSASAERGRPPQGWPSRPEPQTSVPPSAARPDVSVVHDWRPDLHPSFEGSGRSTAGGRRCVRGRGRTPRPRRARGRPGPSGSGTASSSRPCSPSSSWPLSRRMRNMPLRRLSTISPSISIFSSLTAMADPFRFRFRQRRRRCESRSHIRPRGTVALSGRAVSVSP